jgi:hypothetical protein
MHRETTMSADYDEQLILDASTDELRGIGSTPAARLVRDNTDARAAATWLLARIDETNTTLTGLAGRGTPPVPDRARRERPPRLSTRLAAGLALALAAILLLLTTHGTPMHEAATPDVEPLTARLDAASDRPFAVFETSNPDIAIVWLLDEETSP